MRADDYRESILDKLADVEWHKNGVQWKNPHGPDIYPQEIYVRSQERKRLNSKEPVEGGE